jgi:hypothetical protein
LTWGQRDRAHRFTATQRLRPGKLSRRGKQARERHSTQYGVGGRQGRYRGCRGCFFDAEFPRDRNLSIKYHATGSDGRGIYTIESEMMQRNKRSPDLASMHGTASLSDDQDEKSTLYLSIKPLCICQIMIERSAGILGLPTSRETNMLLPQISDITSFANEIRGRSSLSREVKISKRCKHLQWKR